MGTLPGATHFYPEAISVDGSVVAGSAMFDDGHSTAFRWTKEGGLTTFAEGQPGSPSVSITDMTPDGEYLVGSDSAGTPFLWTATRGLLPVQSFLESEQGLGPTIGDWTLRQVGGISDDGRVLAGSAERTDATLGKQTAAWRVVLSTLIQGDANRDGKVDLTDFGILKDNFGTGTTLAQGDANGDTKVDLTDFGILKNNFGKSGAIVPEPTSLVLAALAGLGMIAFHLNATRASKS